MSAMDFLTSLVSKSDEEFEKATSDSIHEDNKAE